MVPQLLIPGETFHMARLRPGGSFALLGSTEWPGVDPEDVEHGDRGELLAAYPTWQEQINQFMDACG
jgi:uncharacterized protein